MSDNPLVAAPVVQPAPVGDTLPVPTPDQEKTADTLFAPATERHAAADLLGMVAAVQFLHDMANETFRRNEEAKRKEELEQSADGRHETEE